LDWVMVTSCNPARRGSQPHVTGAAGNLLYPTFQSRPTSMSQPVRRTFDIVKAKARLGASGKTYVDLGRRLGVTRQAVGHWFRGRGEPDVQQMKRMAEVLGCHWLELVTDETTVLYREEELRHYDLLRQLSPEQRSEVEDFIKFKLGNKGE
jgi:Predicted transcriptional regulators